MLSTNLKGKIRKGILRSTETVKKAQRSTEAFKVTSSHNALPTQPNANGRLFPVPKGTVAIGGRRDNLRSETTPRSHPAVPSPPAT